MKISQIIESTTSGSVAPVSHSFVKMHTRNPSVSDKKGNNLLVGKKTNKKYMNSLSESKMKDLALDLTNGKDGLSDTAFKKKYGKTKQEMRKSMATQPQQPKKVEEAKLDEEDKIISPDKGSKLKTGLHGKGSQPKTLNFFAPFKSQGIWVSDKRGKNVCECSSRDIAPIVAKALNQYAGTNESIEIEEGAKVDRMVKHIKSSEKKLGKSNKEAENIAWATANKRGMLDNKNKKKSGE